MANEPHDRVMAGQVWKDRDSRMSNRLVRVLRCESGYAHCEEGYELNGQYQAHKHQGKPVRIRMDRMKARGGAFAPYAL